MRLKQPVRTLIVAGVCIAALAATGVNVENKLHQTSLSVSGTESARTGTLLQHYFGRSEPFVILLKGPPKEVNRQGQQLARVLNRDPLATTISPWSREATGQLRPTRRSVVIFVSFRVSLDEAVKQTVPHLNALLSRHVSPPVRAVQSGYASVSRAIQDEATQATRRGELIAVPLVLLVLLLVFRSPIAASIPLVFGAATVAGSRGVLSIAANWLSIDAFALTAGAMMGLALGVDYTLLMVSRFREELIAGKSTAAAAEATRRTAGRTIAFAGSVLSVSLIASVAVLPGTFLVSLAGAVVVVTGLSVVLGVLVVPAVLALLGKRINAWSIGEGRGNLVPWPRILESVSRRPGLVAAVLVVPLTLLALPAISLSMGPPSFDQLPASNRARLNAELVNKEIGPGWAAPYVVLAATNAGPITSQQKLAELTQWEKGVSRFKGVLAVIGPGAIASRVAPIREFGHSFLAQDRPGSQATKLQQLGSQLDRATQGVRTLRGGIANATYGAGLLSEGSQNVDRGAQMLAGELARAAAGSGKAVVALDRLASGARDLHRGQRRTALGALALKYDIQDLIPRLRHSTLYPSRNLAHDLDDMQSLVPNLESRVEDADKQLSAALFEFQSVPEVTDDPRYSLALKAVEAAQDAIGGGTGDKAGVSVELQTLGRDIDHATERAAMVTSGVEAGLGSLQEAAPLSKRLARGLNRLEHGGRSLDSGAHRLAHSASALADGLPHLSRGAVALSGGAKQLALGTSSLAGGLGQAYTVSHPLEPGLRRAATESSNHAAALRRLSRRLRRFSPGLFKSGYFNLAALDGALPDLRSRASQAVDVNHGGQAARILVIPRYSSNTAGSLAIDSRLRAAAPALGRRVGGVTGVAGGPAVLHDYAHTSGSRLPIVIGIVSLMTFICLVLVLRAIIVSVVAVLLNLISVAIAFGVLSLVAALPDGAPIGHWEYIDTIGAVAIFAIAFGVSIDYSVFILARMREEFDQHGDHKVAVQVGVQRTGRIVTGAALMMIVVFTAFATSSLAIVSQLGAGLTAAILMDATVIRLVLLPTLLLLIGKRCWWLPLPLARFLKAARFT